MKFILTFMLCICSISVNAERVSPAIWEYMNCRNTLMQNAFNPRPKAPEWMRQSNLKCHEISFFNIDSTKLTMLEFNSHWRNSGGPELLESTFAELGRTSHERGLPKELLYRFEKHTKGSPLSNLMGLTTSYEKIQKNLRTVDLFSSNEATTILVMSRSTGSLSNNKLLLEVMLKRRFAQTGRLEIAPTLKKVLGPPQRQIKHVTLYSLLKSKNYINFILVAHKLIEEGANEEITRIKTSITDRNRITFFCPDLFDYISYTHSPLALLRGGDFNASPSCRKWYNEVATEAGFKLERIRSAFLSEQNLLKPQIEERIK